MIPNKTTNGLECTECFGLSSHGAPSCEHCSASFGTLPDGINPADLWTPGDESSLWPEPSEGFFYGPIGRFSLEAAQHTEADPVAIFMQTLVLFGAALNRTAYVQAGNARHAANFFVLIVGATAKGGKGTSFQVAKGMAEVFDPGLARDRILSGFGSGEAIIHTLAGGDDGPTDSRLVVVESEFAAAQSRSNREGSTLSHTFRDGWDGAPIQNRTRSGGDVIARDYHLAVIGHVVAEEFNLKLSASDAFGGFANRFLIAEVRRGKLQPGGGNVPDELLERYGHELRAAVRAGRTRGRMYRTPDADLVWNALYTELADDDPPGLLGRALARSSPQCLRLSLVLALADKADAIGAEHVLAAASIWNYCRASAAHVLGDAVGDLDADRLLDALRQAPEGMNATAQRDLFARRPGHADRARSVLEKAGLAVTVSIPTGGRPEQRTYALRQKTKATKAPATEVTEGLSSLMSLVAPSHDESEGAA